MSLTNEERQIMVTLEIEKADRFFIQAKKNTDLTDQRDFVACARD